MKNKKESRKRESSSSSSSSSNSSSSNSDRSASKSAERKPKPSVDKHSKDKYPAKRTRSPRRDQKSKWDSPDDRAEKRRAPDRGGGGQNSKERSDRPRNSRPDRAKDYRPRENSRERKHNIRETQHREHSTDHDRHRDTRQRDDNSRDRSRHRKEVDTAPKRNRERNERKRSRSPQRFNNRRRRRSRSFDHSKAVWGKAEHNEKKAPEAPKEKEQPNFGLSGKLTEETNTYKGVVIKYSEPPEARKPKRRWRLYPFKGEKAMQTLYIHRESAYLVGRDRKLVDIPVDHPSCSKQHAALQYRLVQFTRDNGSVGKRVRPYLIDLESANGTYINNKKIDAKKYTELLERDVIKFGFSSREYVVLHENSKDEAQDDDVHDDPPQPPPAADAAPPAVQSEQT